MFLSERTYRGREFFLKISSFLAPKKSLNALRTIIYDCEKCNFAHISGNKSRRCLYKYLYLRGYVSNGYRKTYLHIYVYVIGEGGQRRSEGNDGCKCVFPSNSVVFCAFIILYVDTCTHENGIFVFDIVNCTS